jgi:hypothetical protein
MDLVSPPLPSQWPYSPRIILEDCQHTSNAKLPGLTGLWCLETSANFKINFYEQESSLELAFGRGGIVHSGSVVLRPYRRGGFVRYVNKNTYQGIERFRQEFYVHRALWRSGLPTVEPIGWAYKSNKFGNEGVFITKFTKGTPWPHAWNQDINFLYKITTMLKALCSWGFYAPDLNATNILVSPGKEPIALDWDRAGWSPKDDLITSYKERLTRSMKKLGAQTDIIVNLRHIMESE